MILLLPDFVAYPFCYLSLLREAAAAERAVAIDYNDHWPYATIDDLAGRIVTNLPPVPIEMLVGYSFGAYVASSLATKLEEMHSASVELVLVDPPTVSTLAQLSRTDICRRLRESDAYQYVFDLVDCGLSDLDCMVENIRMLGHSEVGGSSRKASRLFLARTSVANGVPDDVARFCCKETQTIVIDGCDHKTILNSAKFKRAFSSLIKVEERG